MNRKMLMRLAISGFALGIGAASTGTIAAPSETASNAAGKARQAMEKGKDARAIGFAEAAVAASPRDAGHRALLGQAYLNDGRFASAATALTDAMELGATDANTVIALTLAHIAQGQTREAVSLLSAHRDSVPASDLGLALALAGDHEAAIYVLTDAARAEGASARTRQNLALTFALSGRWAQARVLASQDLPLNKVEARMTEWSQLAEQPDARLRVASLLGAKAQADAGMPVRLALNNHPAAAPVALASADPAPVELYAPPPPPPAAMAEAPRAAAAPVTQLAAPQPTGEVILADAAPYRSAPQDRAETLRPAQKQAMELATRIVPRAMGFDAKKPSGWAVQLGAYDSLGIAREKWGSLKQRNAMLADFPASSHVATVKGRTFHRLTVNGLATRADATELCRQLKAQGQVCFIREMGQGETIQWAAKVSPNPVRLASR